MWAFRKFYTGVLVAAAVFVGASGANANTYTPITNFVPDTTCASCNGNVQTGLISTFPTGTYTPTNGVDGVTGNTFGAPFTLGPSVLNFVQIYVPLTVTTNVSNVTNVFTLMNAYSPIPNTVVGTVEFLGTGGASDTFNLVAGTDIRDFYQNPLNIYANTINGTTTQNAFSCTDPSTCLGAGGTGNVQTGGQGDYRIDEQDFTLNASFVGQSLTQIIFTPNDNGDGTPILLGITAADITPSSTPLPGTLPFFASGLGALGLFGWRRKRKNAAALAA